MYRNRLRDNKEILPISTDFDIRTYFSLDIEKNWLSISGYQDLTVLTGLVGMQNCFSHLVSRTYSALNSNGSRFPMCSV
jgi:hypothetical protein